MKTKENKPSINCSSLKFYDPDKSIRALLDEAVGRIPTEKPIGINKRIIELGLKEFFSRLESAV